jgi:DNA-binding LytR/AlgR family response regulator
MTTKALKDQVILIVEDNQEFDFLLQSILQQIGFRNIHNAANYDEAMYAISKHVIDVFIIDIQLENSKNGVMIAEEIRSMEKNTPIIFITAYFTEENYEYARQTRPSCFLNKELSKLKLHQAIDLALLTQAEEKYSEPVGSKQVNAPLVSSSNLFFRIGDTYKAIPISDVAYFFADKKLSYAKIGNRSYPTSVQLKTLEDELPKEQFIRIHKSYIVNTKYIESILPGESTIILNGETLPIGSVYRKVFLAALKLLR